MSNVNAYYAVPTVATPTANATQPTPVTVAVNNVAQPAAPGTTSVAGLPAGFNADAYISTATKFATQAAPYAPGAVAGAKAAKGIGLAKEQFAKASRSRSLSTKANAGAQGRSLAFGGILSAVKSSVIFNGLVSLSLNGYKVFKGEQKISDAGGNVAGDVASAAVGGAAGAAASAAGTALLAGVLGTGLPLTLVGLGLGIGGYMLADGLFRKTGIFNTIKQGTHDLIAKVTSK